MTDLRKLHINAYYIEDDGLKHLAGMKRLEELTIIQAKCGFNENVAKWLAATETLKRLELQVSYVSDAALEELVRFRALRSLDFNSKGLNDASLKAIAKLDQLSVLGLGFCPITDEGLQHIPQMKNLSGLYLQYTNVTDAGVKRLKDAMPELSIDATIKE